MPYVALGYWVNGYAEGDFIQLTATSIHTNANNFFTPTVDRGPVTVGVSILVTNTDTVYAPSIQVGPRTLTQSSLFVNNNVINNHVLGIPLYPSLFTNTSNFYGPTVQRGAVTLTATRYDNISSFYGPSLRFILPQNTRAANTSNFFSPSLRFVLPQNTVAINTSNFFSPFVSNIVYITSDNSTQVSSTGIALPIFTNNTTQVNYTTVNTITKNTKMGILYKNVADLGSITTSSTSMVGFPITNLQSEHKYKLWRVSGNTANINITWTTGQTLSAIILPISNLDSSAVIRIRTYSDEAGTSIISDTGNQLPILPTQSSTGINTYTHNSISIARIFISKVSNIKHCKIDIINNTPQGYIEISRLVCGELWTPTYGTTYGLSSIYLSDSKHSRTEAGNIYTNRDNVYKSLSFDLGYLTKEDRQELLKIINNNGKHTPIFVSIFPNSEDPAREELYQIYGNVLDDPLLTNPIYNIYSTKITLESA